MMDQQRWRRGRADIDSAPPPPPPSPTRDGSHPSAPPALSAVPQEYTRFVNYDYVFPLAYTLWEYWVYFSTVTYCVTGRGLFSIYEDECYVIADMQGERHEQFFWFFPIFMEDCGYYDVTNAVDK